MLYSGGAAYLFWNSKRQFKVPFQIMINVGQIILDCTVQLNFFMLYHCFPYSLLCPLKALYPIPVSHLYQFLYFTKLSGSLPFLQRTLPLKICKCHFQSDNMEMSFPDWYCFPSHVLLEQGPSASLHSFPACDGILFCNAIQYEEQYTHIIDDPHYVSFFS